MKKVLIIIFLFSFFIVGCSKNKIANISLEELNNKLNNKESFILYFQHDKSNTLKNKLNNILEKYNLNGYSLNSEKLSEQEEEELKMIIPFEKPSIVFIVNGKDPSKLAHITNENIREIEIIARLKDMNFIKDE